MIKYNWKIMCRTKKRRILCNPILRPKACKICLGDVNLDPVHFIRRESVEGQTSSSNTYFDGEKKQHGIIIRSMYLRNLR